MLVRPALRSSRSPGASPAPAASSPTFQRGSAIPLPGTCTGSHCSHDFCSEATSSMRPYWAFSSFLSTCRRFLSSAACMRPSCAWSTFFTASHRFDHRCGHFSPPVLVASEVVFSSASSLSSLTTLSIFWLRSSSIAPLRRCHTRTWLLWKGLRFLRLASSASAASRACRAAMSRSGSVGASVTVSLALADSMCRIFSRCTPSISAREEPSPACMSFCTTSSAGTSPNSSRPTERLTSVAGSVPSLPMRTILTVVFSVLDR
mmetsp:Transcript_59906/g.143944  ORF Transcript_59906/g.143944 Transcript_59906/m.143944 type:complete len:261 (-) Transcript_59906:78-860(-)